MNLQPYLNFAKQLAYRAGRITLSFYNKGIQHDLKSDESPVTAADKATEELNRLWPTIPLHRFEEKDVAFGQWPGTGLSFVQYFVDNEIHHRGQAYVYLRTLGIEPPAFWDRP